MKLTDVLETYRKAKGYSHREFAKQIGIDHTHLFHMLNDRKKQDTKMRTWTPIYNWLVGK